MFLVDHELPTSSCDNINESTNSPFQEPVEEIDEPNEGNETNEVCSLQSFYHSFLLQN